jgi:hypothetical protein
MRFHFLPILPLLIAITGCVNTDAAVFVEPSIESPTAVVKGGALGVTIEGTFTLKLHLGPRASGPSTVDLRDFNILDAKQSGTLAPIEISKSSITFPTTVDLDSDITSDLTFDVGTKTLTSATKTKLCDAAGVIIGGTIQDSLQATSTPFFSPIVHPTGCP